MISLKPLICSILFVMGLASNIFAQDDHLSKITGIVKSLDDELLPFASIKNLTQKKEVRADIEGTFSILAQIGDTLLVSVVGFTERKYVVSDSTLTNSNTFILAENVFGLEEIVISGSTSKKNKGNTIFLTRVKNCKGKIDSLRSMHEILYSENLKYLYAEVLSTGQFKTISDSLKKEFDRKIKNAKDICEIRNSSTVPLLWPNRNTTHTRSFYGSNKNAEFFSFGDLSFGEKSGTIRSNLVSGYISSFRVSLLSNVSKVKTETVNPEDIKDLSPEEVQNKLLTVDSLNLFNNSLMKIASGGGEATLAINAVLLNHESIYSNFFKNQTEFIGKLSFDVPIASTSVLAKETNSYLDFGIYNRAKLNLIGNDGTFSGLGFVADIGYSLIAKASKSFYENIGLSTKKGFTMTTFTLGLEYGGLNIYYTHQLFNRKELNDLNAGPRIGARLVKIIN